MLLKRLWTALARAVSAPDLRLEENTQQPPVLFLVKHRGLKMAVGSREAALAKLVTQPGFIIWPAGMLERYAAHHEGGVVPWLADYLPAFAERSREMAGQMRAALAEAR